MTSDRHIEHAQMFRALHLGPELFVMPNCWDVGSAQMLAGFGAKAIATASAGLAGTMGLPDGGVGRERALAHARAVVEAVNVPVSADLENGYADSPDGVAETVRMAIDTGLAGCSIEDKLHGSAQFYDAGLAEERIAAAVEAAKGANRPFTLTARADGYLGGGYDLEEAISRALSFARLGANVIFVPGIPEGEALTRLCAETSVPVSHLTGIDTPGQPVAQLAALGVKRVSTGPMLFRTAMGAAAEAVQTLLDTGDVRTLVAKPGWSDAAQAMRSGRKAAS